MKNMIIILKHIFIPVSAFSFLIFGQLASFCSAVIEFFVLKEFLTVKNPSIDSGIWAALIIFVLEGSKLTLHFYSMSLKRLDLKQADLDFDLKKRIRLIDGVKSGLVAFSVFCSIVFTINILYHDHDAKVEAALEDDRLQCEELMREKKAELAAEKQNFITDGLAACAADEDYLTCLRDELTKKENEIKNEPYPNRRADLMAEAAAIRAELAEVSRTLSQSKLAVTEAAQKRYEEGIAELEALYGENGFLRLTADSAEIVIQGHNAYLSNFLLAITRTFFGTAYSQKTYFFICLSIAVALALILEICISLSQMFLTISEESFVKIIGHISRPEHGKEAVKLILWLAFSSLISTAAFLAARILLGVTGDSVDIRQVILTYLIVTGLTNLITVARPKGDLRTCLEERFAGAGLVLGSLQSILGDMLIPATLCFVGYSIIGFICNGNFIYGDMNGLAIAVGGAFAKMVKYNQCTMNA